MDITLARESIGYNPTTSLREGLEITWDWFQKNKDQYKKKKITFQQKNNK